MRATSAKRKSLGRRAISLAVAALLCLTMIPAISLAATQGAEGDDIGGTWTGSGYSLSDDGRTATLTGASKFSFYVPAAGTLTYGVSVTKESSDIRFYAPDFTNGLYILDSALSGIRSAPVNAGMYSFEVVRDDKEFEMSISSVKLTEADGTVHDILFNKEVGEFQDGSEVGDITGSWTGNGYTPSSSGKSVRMTSGSTFMFVVPFASKLEYCVSVAKGNYTQRFYSPNWMDGVYTGSSILVGEHTKNLDPGTYTFQSGNGDGYDLTIEWAKVIDATGKEHVIRFAEASAGGTIEDAVISPVGDQPWTGEPIVPEVSVTLNGMLLDPETDYDVVASNNIEPGTAIVTVTGKGAFIGQASSTFNIVKLLDPATGYVSGLWSGSGYSVVDDGSSAEISNATFTFIAPEKGDLSIVYERRGADEKLVSPTGVYSAWGDGSHVSATSNAGINASAKLQFSSMSTEGSWVVSNVVYKGTSGKTYLVVFDNAVPSAELIDIAEATVSDVLDQIFTGNAIEPDFTVTFAGKTLEKGTDYTVEYKNNKKIGTAKATLIGKGAYRGTLVKTFNIVSGESLPSDISEAVIADIPDQVWTGEPIEPALAVTLGGRPLAKGTDYTVKFEDNVDEGTAMATLSGAGFYKGVAIKEFKIRKVAENDLLRAVIADIPDQVWTGAPIEPELKVTLGDKLLTKGTDYDVQFENNKNLGIATATITGKGSYSGTITKQFTISRIPLKEDMFAAIVNQTYTGRAFDPAELVSSSVVPGSAYTVVAKVGCDLTKTGEQAIVVIANENGSYEGSVELSFQIVGDKLKSFDVGSLTYNGQMQRPLITNVTSETGAELAPSDYTVTYNKAAGDIKDAGIYKVTVTGEGGFEGSIEKEFTISPAAFTVAEIEGVSFTGKNVAPESFDATMVDNSSVRLVEGKDYDVTCTTAEGKTVEDPHNISDAGSYIYLFKGKGNYAGSSCARVFDVNADSLIVDPIAEQAYDGKDKTPNLVVRVGNKVLSATDYWVEYYLDNKKAEAGKIVDAGNYRAVVVGTGSYSGMQQQVSFVVKPVPITSVKEIADVVYNGSSQAPSVVALSGNSVIAGEGAYTVAFKDSAGQTLGEEQVISVGVYTVEVHGTGNCTGSASRSFEIVAPTVVDEKTGISVSGTFLVDLAKAQGLDRVQPTIFKLEEGADEYKKALSQYLEKNSVAFDVYSITLEKIKDGKSVGFITELDEPCHVFIPVDSSYEGRTVKVLESHEKADGATELIEFYAKVFKGGVLLAVDKFSSFATSVPAIQGEKVIEVEDNYEPMNPDDSNDGDQSDADDKSGDAAVGQVANAAANAANAAAAVPNAAAVVPNAAAALGSTGDSTNAASIAAFMLVMFGGIAFIARRMKA